MGLKENKEKKNGLKEKKRTGTMALFPFTQLQIKENKKGLKEKKRKGRMKKWVLGNEVMCLPMCVRVFIKWVMNIVVFIS